jgi:hypothetical protein
MRLPCEYVEYIFYPKLLIRHDPKVHFSDYS